MLILKVYTVLFNHECEYYYYIYKSFWPYGLVRGLLERDLTSHQGNTKYQTEQKYATFRIYSFTFGIVEYIHVYFDFIILQKKAGEFCLTHTELIFFSETLHTAE